MNDDPAGARDFLDVLATTRAIRRFQDEEIPDEDLARLFHAASRAPSASNRQNFRFLVLRRGRDDRVRGILGAEYRRSWAEKSQRDGYTAAAAKSTGSRAARMATAMEQFVDRFEQIPIVALPLLIRYKPADPLEGASVYPACQNLLLAARALGYGGVLTQWHVGVEATLRTELGIPDEVAMCGVIALGRPVGRHGPVRRLPLRNIVFQSTWGESAAWAEDPEGTSFTVAGPPKNGG